MKLLLLKNSQCNMDVWQVAFHFSKVRMSFRGKMLLKLDSAYNKLYSLWGRLGKP